MQGLSAEEQVMCDARLESDPRFSGVFQPWVLHERSNDPDYVVVRRDVVWTPNEIVWFDSLSGGCSLGLEGKRWLVLEVVKNSRSGGRVDAHIRCPNAMTCIYRMPQIGGLTEFARLDFMAEYAMALIDKMLSKTWILRS